MFKRVGKVDTSLSISDDLIYITIHDAVLYAKKKFSS